MNDEDLYGAPHDSSWLYAWPRSGGQPDIPEIAAVRAQNAAYDKQQAQRTAAWQARQAQAAQQQAQQPQAEPAAFISYEQFKAANANADPQEVYDKYVSEIGPRQALARGFSLEDVKQTTEWFKQQYPRPAAPAKQKPPEDKGMLSNAWDALTQGFRSGTKAQEIDLALAEQNKDKLAQLIAEPSPDPSKPMSAFQAELGKSKNDSYWQVAKDIVAAAVKEPQGAIDFQLYQLAQSYPSLLGALVGGVGGLAVGGPVGAVAGVALGAGTGSLNVEIGSQVQENIQQAMVKAGVDPTNEAQVRQFIGDKDNYEKVVLPAIKKGVVVGAVDGLTALVSTKAGQMAVQMGRQAVTSPLKRAGVVAGGIAVEPAGGAAGEALSRAAAGMPSSPMDVEMEAFGELAGGAAHVAGGAVSAGKRLVTGAPATPAVTPTTPATPAAPVAPRPAKSQFISDEEIARREAPPPTVTPEEEVLLTPDERNALYAHSRPITLDNDQGVRTALGLDRPGTKELQAAIAAVAQAPEEGKVGALMDLLQVAQSGKAAYNEALGTQVSTVLQGIIDARINAELLAQYDPMVEADPEAAADTLTAVSVARDLLNGVTNEQAQAAGAAEQAAGAQPQSTEVAAAAAAVQPGAKLKRGRKPSARAAAAAGPAAVSTAPVETGGQPPANAPVLPGLGQALAAASGSGERTEGPARAPGKGRRGLKRAESTAAAAGGVAATAGESVVPEGAAGVEGSKVTKPTFLRWLQEEKDISWGGFPNLPKEQQAQLRNEYGAIPGEIVGGLAAKKAGQQPGKVTVTKPKAEEAQASEDVREAERLAAIERGKAAPVPTDDMMRDAGLTESEITRLKRDPDYYKFDQINRGFAWLEGSFRPITKEDVVHYEQAAEANKKKRATDKKLLDKAFAEAKAKGNEFPQVSDILGSDWYIGHGDYKNAAYAHLELKHGYAARQVPRLKRVLKLAEKNEPKEKGEAKIDRNKVRDRQIDANTIKLRLQTLQAMVDTDRAFLELERSTRNKTPGRIEELEQRIADDEESIESLKNVLAEVEADAKNEEALVNKLEKGSFLKAIQDLIAQGRINKNDQQFYDAIATGDTRAALAFVEQNSKNLMYKLVAHALRISAIVPRVQFGERPISVLGSYWMEQDRIMIDAGEFLQEAEAGHTGKLMNTLLHEVVHGGTVNALSQAYGIYSGAVTKVGAAYTKSEEYQSAVRIFQVFDWLKENDKFYIHHDSGGATSLYAGTNPLELAAEIFVNTELQEHLKTVQLPKELTGGTLKTAWTWFINELKKLLGFVGVPNNALEQVIRDVSNVLRHREWETSPVTGTKYVPAFNEAPATREEIAGRYAINKKYKAGNTLKNAIAEDQEAAEKADTATGRVQTGAITGHDPVTHERTHIAYVDKKTGTYRLYEVSDPNTAEGLRGDPESRQDVGTREQVMALLRTAGAEAIEHTREFVGGMPEDSVHRKVGWENGVLKYQANEQTGGSWKVYRSDDLHDASKPMEVIRVNNYAEALQLYDGTRLSKTERQSQVRAENDQVRNLGEREFNPAHWSNRDMFDRQADLKRFGYQAALEAEKHNQQIPDDQRVDYLTVLKNSHAETEINRGFEKTYRPLFAKGRELMKRFNWGAQLVADLHTALVVNERFPKARLHFTPEVEAKYGAQHAADLKAAQDLLQRYAPTDSPARAALETYAKQWKQAQNDVIDIRVRNKMLTPEVGERIKRAYTYYAPLGEGMPSLRKGSTGRSAKGEQIYQKMVQQFTKAVIEGVDNNIKRTIAANVKNYVRMTHEGKPLIEVAPVLGVRRNLDTGAIEEYIDTAAMNRRSLIYYDENAEPMRMLVNYEPLLKALDSFPEQNRSTVMQKIMAGSAMFNYLYGTTKTVFSPVFGVVNFMRDNFTTVAQLDRDINYRTWLASYLSPKVWGAAVLEGFAPNSKTLLEGSGPVASFARDAMENGALINRKYRLGLDELSRTVGYTLNPTLWGYTKQFGSLEGPLFNALSGFTKTMENVTRMAVYDAALHSKSKKGLTEGQPLSKIRAGLAAKNATVNFEPKGEFAGILNPLYVFANARMQGLRTLGMNLGAQQGGQAGNLRTQVAAGAAVFLGLLAGYLLWSSSEKDKDGKKRAGKIPDYKRDSMFIFDEKVVGVPIPQELGAFYVLGNSLADYMFGDKKDKGEAAVARAVTNWVQNFWPSGSAQYDPIGYNASTSDYLARMVAPTPYLLVHDLSTNKTTFGSEVVRNKERLLKQGIPLSEMGSPTSSPLAVSAARTAARFGLESAPQQWEYLAKQLVAPQINMMKWITGQEPLYEGQRTNPFAARLLPDVSKYADRDAYDRAKTDVENAYQKWKRADPAEREEIRQRYDKLIRIRPEMHSIEGQIDKLFQGIRKMTPEQRVEKYKQADKRAEELRTKALKRYYEATE